MKLSIGIVGLPNVGKSTLFNLLTTQQVLAANYPFATIDPNVGVVPVPDARVDALAELSKSKKKIPAVVEFYDIAGLVKGANKGEGLGNQFLSHIRDTQAIIVVLRIFRDEDVIHVEETVDPIRDLEIIDTELALKDLETVGKRLIKAEGEARTGLKEAVELAAALNRAKQILEKGLPLSVSEEYPGILEHAGMSDLNLLTAKKRFYLLNGKESDVSEELTKKISLLGGEYVAANLATASDLAPLIKKSYKVLDLVSFFTTGEDETRAWTIKKGTKAPSAAGVIHTDFEKKFIRAEVVSCGELIKAGGWPQAKQKGRLRLEGKEYEVQDGDVMVIRHG